MDENNALIIFYQKMIDSLLSILNEQQREEFRILFEKEQIALQEELQLRAVLNSLGIEIKTDNQQ